MVVKVTNAFEHVMKDSDIHYEKYFDAQYGLTIPALQVSYERSYFTYKSMRMTFDDNITYKSREDGFKRAYYDPERVVEIKVPADYSDDYIEAQIPFATSRFSKFSRGLLLCSNTLNQF